MKLSDKNRETLLLEIHKTIEEYANYAANSIYENRIGELSEYPSNGGYTENEKRELNKLRQNADLKSALRKVIASSSGSAFFSILNIIDGTADPEVGLNNWSEVMLVDFSEDNEIDSMLHDSFYETYWDWRVKRKNKSWKLDMIDEV